MHRGYYYLLVGQAHSSALRYPEETHIMRGGDYIQSGGESDSRTRACVARAVYAHRSQLESFLNGREGLEC
jgi:hypothetical protein